LHFDLLDLEQRHLQPGFRGREFRQPGIAFRQLAPQCRDFFLKCLDNGHEPSLSVPASMYKDSLGVFKRS
jgi:hypothetical protein